MYNYITYYIRKIASKLNVSNNNDKEYEEYKGSIITYKIDDSIIIQFID
jgi:hypothetical protein